MMGYASVRVWLAGTVSMGARGKGLTDALLSRMRRTALRRFSSIG